MDTSALKKFAQAARRQLLEQVAARMEQVLLTDSVEIREKERAVKELQGRIKSSSKKAVIDRVAYTWFNRFCALRYMDINHYTRIGIVSPVEGFTQPEILQEAKQGVINHFFRVDKQRVFDLLSGQLPSSNPQQEAYRLLLVGACSAYHAQMPFLFPEIEDYTELLMPDDLLSENSILQVVRRALTPEACQDVEVIGWLYQFYISERKDEVISSKKKIPPEDIPAATQLFTPHWIVRYLVENSLGHLWMLNHPDSNLIGRMDYYIKPSQEETNFLEISSPEYIKVCDPACGSGHMLTYAFDLLYAIYEEQGYDPIQIPSLILKNNLYGIEIDKRAGDLAAFALLMKSREKDRRFFSRGVEPNISVLQNFTFSPGELDSYKNAIGTDLFTIPLWETLQQFEDAQHFGSLIRPNVRNPHQMRDLLAEKGMGNDLFLHATHQKVMGLLDMASRLNRHYDVVVANPPYMGNRNMNYELRQFAKDFYKNTKSDLFAMFIERGFELAKINGYCAMVTMQSWMFLPSYIKLRKQMMKEKTILSMTHMANMVMGIAFGTTAAIWKNARMPEYKGHFSYVNYKDLTDDNVPFEFPIQNERLCTASATDFKKIPGVPIAYWLNDVIRETFVQSKLGQLGDFKNGMTTGNNDKFLRLWFEVPLSNIYFSANNRQEAKKTKSKWFPYSKGGKFRKWYGNNEFLVNWENDGESLYNNRPKSIIRNPQYYFREAITWSLTSSSSFGARFRPKGQIFDVNGMSSFLKKFNIEAIALLNSNISSYLLKVINPTMAFQAGDIERIPFKNPNSDKLAGNTIKLIEMARSDWDSFETSWDFQEHPIIGESHDFPTLSGSYKSVRTKWQKIIEETNDLEEQNNQIFIEAYNLLEDISPTVPIDKITLFCNPHYRYGPNKSGAELEAMLLEDTMKEFISYAVGCMFGRYSLDKPGFILANAGETSKDFYWQVPEPSLPPDRDNVIPILEGEWFKDDIAERFRDFLKVTFGTKNFDENLAYLEEAIGRDIRSYFVKDFFNEHVKMYNRRPIYWLFSSPNGSFNALIYMHRYRPDTISVILNDYLRQYRDKLGAHKAHRGAIERNPNASQREKTKALKEIEQINQVLAELKEYEDEILYPLATQKLEIDLDDGVKVNYNKFGKALKKVSGLSQ